MDFGLNETERMIQKTAYDFGQKQLLPTAAEADDDESFCEKRIELLRKTDYFGILIPEEYGGAGMTSLENILVHEQISRSCMSTAAIIGAHNLLVYPLHLMGNEAQKECYLSGLASGERIGAFCLTEANTGSDVASIEATAVRDGDEYVINGVKQFITNGGVASTMVVFASTDRSKAHRGISAFVVEKGNPGLRVGKKENKMGIRGTNTSQVIFTNCRVPVENRLGEEGDGFKLALMTLDQARPGVASQALGLAQAALDLAIDYAKQRVVFGKPLSEHQATRFTLVEMATRLEAARLLVYRAAWAASYSKTRFSKEASMAKLYASEMAHFVVDKALQIHGGYGYMKEYTIERLYRDQRILEIYEGTSEIHKLVISGSLLQ